MMEKNKKITAYPNQNAATNAISHGVFQQNRPNLAVPDILGHGENVLI
jgi:hypothetical protein